MDFPFQTRYARHRTPPEVNSGKQVVDPSGYVDHNKLIKKMIEAGEALDRTRGGVYEFSPDEEIPDDYVDPTRFPGYDLADALRDADIVEERISAAKEALRAEAARQQAEKAAQGSQGQPQPAPPQS